jgi:hypothetical protein
MQNESETDEPSIDPLACNLSLTIISFNACFGIGNVFSAKVELAMPPYD